MIENLIGKLNSRPNITMKTFWYFCHYPRSNRKKRAHELTSAIKIRRPDNLIAKANLNVEPREDQDLYA